MSSEAKALELFICLMCLGPVSATGQTLRIPIK